ncbi:MAG: hypothetical protein H6807_16740 [Planctomycetes bacterium]|nr:hypothetical protein [Planctomycetota bacterium]
MKISRGGRFWVAIVLWCAVAAMLIFRGLHFAWHQIPEMNTKLIALGIALVIGVAKGYFVISRSAERNAGYIARRPEQDWFFLCFHPVMYLLIPLMIGMGLALKAYAQPVIVLAVYVAIGVALLTAARGMWQHKRELAG